MNVPKLRFKEFDGEWEENFLERTIYVKSGKDYKHLDKGNIPVYGTGGYMLSVNDYLSDKDAIGIGRKGSIDKPQKLKAPFWTVDTLFYCIPKQDHNLSFLFTLFQKIPWKRYDESTGVPSLSKSSIEKIKINIPPNDEQEKIGGFFKELDKKIQLQQQKIDLLQEQKKGYMQKIFNQEIRFKDENEEYYSEWEEYTLNDLGETYTGLSGKTKEDFGFGEHSFVTYVNVFNNLFAKSSGVEKVIIEENEKQNYVKTGDIFLTTSSETPREVGMASIWKHDSTNLHLNSFCFGYRITNSTMLPDFLAISLRSEYMRNKITILAQGSTRYNISKTALMKEQVYVPSIREQKKIVEFHHKLSSVIELEMQKLTALKQQKQGFMQQMFI